MGKSPLTTIEVLQIPVAAIVPSIFNPRGKHSEDAADLKALTDDVKRRGVLEAIMVRPFGSRDQGKYEIVFGERRWRASKAAELKTIPCMVRELSSYEAAELATVENLHRKDLHFLDEARGFLKLGSDGKTADDIAEMIGKPAVYIYQRLALSRLRPKWEAKAYAGQLPLGPALLLARQTKETQDGCFKYFFSERSANRTSAISSAEIKEYLAEYVIRSLAKAPFELDDAELLPKAGTCLLCPKRTGANPKLFADIKETDVCTDGTCFDAKLRAYLVLRETKYPGAAKVMGEGLDWRSRQSAEKEGLIQPREFDSRGWVKSVKEGCEQTKDALIAAGTNFGAHIYICVDAACPIHGDRRRAGLGRAARAPGQMDPVRKEMIEKMWKWKSGQQRRIALHQALRDWEAQAGPGIEFLPLEAMRFIVSLCLKDIRISSEGNEYLQKLYPVSEERSVKAGKDPFFTRGAVAIALMDAREQKVMLTLLVDALLASDAAGKWGIDDQTETLAGLCGLDVAAIAAPIVADWEAKKKASYEKRDARLLREREKAAGKKAEKSAEPGKAKTPRKGKAAPKAKNNAPAGVAK